MTICSLFRKTNEYSHAEAAIDALSTAEMANDTLEFIRFEVRVLFSNTDKIEGEFHQETVVEVLQRYTTAL